MTGSASPRTLPDVTLGGLLQANDHDQLSALSDTADSMLRKLTDIRETKVYSTFSSQRVPPSLATMLQSLPQYSCFYASLLLAKDLKTLHELAAGTETLSADLETFHGIRPRTKSLVCGVLHTFRDLLTDMATRISDPNLPFCFNGRAPHRATLSRLNEFSTAELDLCMSNLLRISEPYDPSQINHWAHRLVREMLDPVEIVNTVRDWDGHLDKLHSEDAAVTCAAISEVLVATAADETDAELLEKSRQILATIRVVLESLQELIREESLKSGQ